MSRQYDNTSHEDIIKENTKQTEAINKYIIGTLKMYITPEIFLKNASGDTKKRKFTSIYYTREYTKTPSEIQKIQKEISNEEEMNKKMLTEPKKLDEIQPQAIQPPAMQPQAMQPRVMQPQAMQPQAMQPRAMQPQAMQPQAMQPQAMQPRAMQPQAMQPRPQEQIIRQPVKVLGGGEGYNSNSGFDVKVTNISSNVINNEPYIASLVKFSNVGFPPYSTTKSQVDTFFNLKAFRAFLKRLGNPIIIRDTQNKPIDVKNLLDRASNNNSSSQNPFKQIFGDSSTQTNSNEKSIQEISKDRTSKINFWSTSEKPQKIGKAFIFVYTIPSPQELRQQAQLSGSGRSTNVNRPMMLMVKDGNDYSLIGGYIDNTIKNIIGNTQITSDKEYDTTKSDVIMRTIEKEVYSKTGTSKFPSSIISKYLLFTPTITGGSSSASSASSAPSASTDDKDQLPSIIYAIQISQSTMQTTIQMSKSRTTLASGELVMVPILSVSNILSGPTQNDNMVLSPTQQKIIELTIKILQNQRIIPQISSGKESVEDYYDDKARMTELAKIISKESISDIDDIIQHNIKFMLGVFFSYKNEFNYSGIHYIINSVDWNNKFKQLKDTKKLLKRMNASYYIELILFLEKVEPGKLPSDRKGTFLESCGVKGALIRNEWKRNFESRTWEDWKKLLPVPTFGKGDGEGQGILDKLVPSFIKKAIKSIQNPLMSPLDPGILQVSLIQYSLLSESELQAFYPKIENSFAGVAWKNDNTWEKRKQRLFASMDESMADVYCFQNVQCSVDVYKKCITDARLTEEDITKLRDINNPITYRKRLDIYFDKIHDALISTPDPDGMNSVNDIYEKYKDSYEFVYFFEQVFYSSVEFNKDPIRASGYNPNMLHPEYSKKVALGNLTMVKKSKFEVVKNLRYDVRMGASFCSGGNKTKFNKFFPELLKIKQQPGTMLSSSTSNFDPSEDFRQQYESMCKNKSFGTMVYIKFRSSAPQQSETIVSEPAPVSEEEIDEKMEKDEKKLEDDNADIIAENVDVDVDVDVDVENPSGGQEGQKGEEEGVKGLQVGGAPSMWYDTDTTEEQGYDRKLNEDVSTKNKAKTKPKTPTDPSLCFGMKDSIFIPTSGNAGKQLFGICNIKFDTNDIVTTGNQGVAPTTYLPEDVMQVILMAVFLNKLKYIMQQFSGLGVLTDLVQKPIIFSGFFRDVFKSGQLSYALKLLTTSVQTPWINKSDGVFGSKGSGVEVANNPLIKFVQSMSILTFLRGGKIRVASFDETKKKIDKFNSNLLGDFYPLKTGSSNSSSVSELIICCDNIKICDDSKIMHKMIPARNNTPNFPIFPNNVNPSNSVAIGAVFDITTPDIVNHVQFVKEREIQRKKDQKDAVVNAQAAAVQREREEQQTATFNKYFNQPPASPAYASATFAPATSTPPPAPASVSASVSAHAPPPPALVLPPASAPAHAPTSTSTTFAHASPSAPASAASAASAASGITKYIFAFDIDNTLVNGGLEQISKDKYEIIANMKRVIDSRNYVWIVTANNAYNKDDFTTKFFRPVDKDFFDKSEYYFLFMNPLIMADVYAKAKSDVTLAPGDKAKLDHTGGWADKDIHARGLKPYAIYAQSLLTRDEYNKKFTPQIGKFDIYLFDDKLGPIQTNSAKFGIHFIQVTDFASSHATPNLLTEFKKVLDNGTSKIDSAKAPFIPNEYSNSAVLAQLMASDAGLPKCDSATSVDKPNFDTPPQQIPDNMIGNMGGTSVTIGNNLEVCTLGVSKCGILPPTSYSTDTDITKWTTSSGDFYSDHEPIKYNYVIDTTKNVVTCASGNTQYDDVNTSFITWNIAYQMTYKVNYYLSKFYCSDAANPPACIEKKEIYEKRMQNILTAIDTIMKNSYNTYTNYVFLQECTPKLIDAVKSVTGFDTRYQIFSNQSEFCLVVRMTAPHTTNDIIIFDFDKNKDGSPAMSKYISDLFYSYDIEVNTYDLKRVMCYIVKSKTTIFFNVHFSFNRKAPYIFQRQAELYNFMNAIVYSIRSIPQINTELYPYQNYDIVFTGDFNVNMLQRFPQGVKRFGYPDGNMIPIFFTCNYIEGQKTIISTTFNNLPTARSKNENQIQSCYNPTNIDFSIFYPRIGDKGTTPTPVTILNGGIPKKKTLPVAPVGSASPVKPTSTPPPVSTSTSTDTLKVMSFNTWYKPFSPSKSKMEYCNVTKDGKTTNVCQENIMKEIMTQIEDGFQVIFLQEFTRRIQEVFDKCTFSDTNVPPTQIPFTMTYTPPGGGSPLEYFVYSVTAQGETITTLCSKKFFPTPATQYYMGNLTGYPNNPLYASDGVTTQFWEISGGGRPYIVLVFDDIEMILINIHGPHGDDFNPYLQKVSKNSNGKGDFINIGEEDKNGPYTHGKTKYKYNHDFGSSIPQAVQNEIDKKIAAVNELNIQYTDLQDYSFRQLGDMLRKRIPQKLKDYKIIFAGDFNMRPDKTKTHLVKLSERQSNGIYNEGPFSNSSGNFDKTPQNSLNLKVGNTSTDATGTCCVEHNGGSYGSGIYDQIYSNKLKITRYWTYNGKIDYTGNGGILFSDHLPVYAEIQLPEPAPSAPSAPSAGGSKRFTLRNNNNNNSNNNNSKSTSRKIKKHASMPTTKFTKKKHPHNKKHKTRRHKH